MGLSIFRKKDDTQTVTLASEGGASLDTLVDQNEQALLEQRKLRAGKEEFDWAKSVDEDLDPEDYTPEEVIDES